MKKLHPTSILTCLVNALIMIALASCNHDVFIDRPDEMGDSQEVTLDGNGENYEFTFKSKGLERVNISHIADCTCEIYSDDDKLISSTDEHAFRVEIPCSVRFINDFIEADIVFYDSGKAVVNVYECAYNFDFKLNLKFDYGDYARYMTITVTPCARYMFGDIDYHLAQASHGEPTELTRSLIINNNSSTEHNLTVSSMGHIRDYIRFDIDGEYSGLFDSENLPLVAVPSPDADGNVGFNGLSGYLTGNMTQEHTSHNQMDVAVTVPAKSSVRVNFTAIYQSITVPFIADAYNPESGRTVRFRGTVSVAVPKSIDCNISDAEKK